MKKRILLITFTLILGACFLSGCGNKVENLDENKEPTIEEVNVSDSSDEKVILETVSDRLLQIETNIEDERTIEYVDAYLEYLESEEELPNEAETMMQNYSKKVQVTIKEKNETQITLSITAPNLAELVDRAIESLKEMKDITSADIEAKVNEYISLGDFDVSSYEVIVNYIEEDGKIILEETIEYLNAIYGGLLNEAQSRYSDYKEGVINE